MFGRFFFLQGSDTTGHLHSVRPCAARLPFHDDWVFGSQTLLLTDGEFEWPLVSPPFFCPPLRTVLITSWPLLKISWNNAPLIVLDNEALMITSHFFFPFTSLPPPPRWEPDHGKVSSLFEIPPLKALSLQLFLSDCQSFSGPA